MATIHVDEDATVWFFTGKSSHKVEEINGLKAVHLIYSHPGKDSYLDLWGNAELVEDRRSKQSRAGV